MPLRVGRALVQTAYHRARRQSDKAARSRAGLEAGRPATTAWLEKVHARPAYQAALVRGGPYAYA